MIPVKTLLKALPWLLACALGAWVYLGQTGGLQGRQTTVESHVLLEKIEALGKLELVRYNFKELTEMNESLAEIAGIKFFESSIILISKGEAVGCVDLAKVSVGDIDADGDTVVVGLPYPELCYYKLDMGQTKVYNLKTASFSNNKAFIEKAYAHAEAQIKASALEAGILDQALDNAALVLKPLLQQIAGKPVRFRYPIKPEPTTIDR